jgi:hypothetical protein
VEQLMNAIIYDIEIKKAIQGKNEERLQDIDYCAGWHDHAGVGISCIGVYDYADERYRLFMDDNIAAFQELVNTRDLIIGFNSIPFDGAVCAANGIDVPEGKSYDILRELWAAAGLGPSFVYPTHMGFGLDAVCLANFGLRKSGNGALAPVDFQRARFGSLVDYCLNDVALTKRLFDKIVSGRPIVDPRNFEADLKPRVPAQANQNQEQQEHA